MPEPFNIDVLRVPAWESIPGLVHGFCGRHGGVSRGPFATLNLSGRVGDDLEAVRENWRRLHQATGGPVRFVTMRQVHGVRVVTVAPETAEVDEADGMVTAAAGVALGVLTADCVPILMIDAKRRIAAAVHAGWRGTLDGIIAQAVEHLQQTFNVVPTALSAALGPAIDGCCYEVDRGLADAFTQRWGELPGAVRPQAETKARLDLRRTAATLLRCAGVGTVHMVGPCTRCTATEYFSHRAAGGTTGRQLGFVGWAPQLGKTAPLC